MGNMGLYLSAIVLGSPNASYGESSSESTVEYMVDICNKTPIRADTSTLLITLTDGGIIVTILSIAIVIAITYLILLLVDPIYRFLGKRGSMVVTRVFAVIVAAFAVQYIVEGVKQIYVTLI
jgi:hypothetical protein